MRIAVAPDSFKESMSAVQAADAMERGIKRAAPDCEVVKIPVADGGEGTVEVLVRATSGELVEAEVTGPLGDRVRAKFGVLGGRHIDTAIIEMAAASGLPLVPKAKRNPLVTTTYGTGELIRCALDHGVKKLIIGIGGSATVDGGAGVVQALGARLLDSEGKQIPPGGGELRRLARIDTSRMDPRIPDTIIQVASDVENPLLGPKGAALVFGPQKGATPEIIQTLEENLRHLADIIGRDMGIRVHDMPGGGAAGGLGAGLVAFCGARLRSGFDIVADILDLNEKLKGCDLIITGEGRMDIQDVFGKAPTAVARLAKKLGVPVVAIVGSLGDGWERVLEQGIDACFSIATGPTTLAEAIQNASPLLEGKTEQVVRLFALGRPKATGGSAAE